MLVVGNLTWDRLLVVDRLPVPNEDALIVADSSFPGGAAGNVAAALALLQQETRLAACVGRDALGTTLREELTQYGVDTSTLREVDEPTASFLCAMDDSGARSFYLNLDEAAFQLDVSDIPRGEDSLTFVGCRLGLAMDILRARPEEATRTFANIGFWSSSRELTAEYVHVLDRFECVFANSQELHALPAPVKARLLSEAYLRGRQVVITAGARPTVVHTSDGVVTTTPARLEGIANTLGCGDAFMGGYLAAYLSGLTPDRCSETAHRCAARVAVLDVERTPDQFDSIPWPP